jgi:putative phage-type endonuclease
VNARHGLTQVEREARTAGLGGSDALAYCGKDPRKTPLELYLEKTGTGSPPEPVDPEAAPDPRMDWGNRLEPVVREWLAEEIGRRIFDAQRFYRSSHYPFMTAHLDGITSGPTEGVEIKTADKFMAQEFGEVGTDQVPVRYVLQCTHYMIVTGISRFHLGALVGGNDARHYIIDLDTDLAAMLIERARAFWHHVQTHTPPAPVTLADTDRRWPASQSRAIVANEAIAHAVTELKALRDAEADSCRKADAIEVTLKAFMQQADALTDARRHVLATWRSQTRERFDQREFNRDHPDLVQQYRTTSSFRVWRLK